jgi:hypothetical protein
MKKVGNLITAFAVLGFLFLLFPRRAHAYLDPGTGSYVIQILAAALVGSAVAVRVFWKNIRLFFDRVFSRGRGHPEVDPEVPEQEGPTQDEE